MGPEVPEFAAGDVGSSVGTGIRVAPGVAHPNIESRIGEQKAGRLVGQVHHPNAAGAQKAMLEQHGRLALGGTVAQNGRVGF